MFKANKEPPNLDLLNATQQAAAWQQDSRLEPRSIFRLTARPSYHPLMDHHQIINGGTMMKNNQALELYIAMPKGGQAARCTARNRGNGAQCSNPARTGFKVCWKHGAGSGKRELERTSKRAGRPLETGMYSQRKLTDVVDLLREIEQLEVDLDNSDQELMVAKAVLWNALNLQPDIAKLKGQLEKALEANAFEHLDDLITTAKMVSRFTYYVNGLQELASNIVKIQKMRSEISNKTMETKLNKQLIEDVQDIRKVLEESLDHESYERIYFQIIRQMKRSRGIDMDVEEGTVKA